jgi:hypothetical protein
MVAKRSQGICSIQVEVIIDRLIRLSKPRSLNVLWCVRDGKHKLRGQLPGRSRIDVQANGIVPMSDGRPNAARKALRKAVHDLARRKGCHYTRDLRAGIVVGEENKGSHFVPRTPICKSRHGAGYHRLLLRCPSSELKQTLFHLVLRDTRRVLRETNQGPTIVCR